MFNISHFFINDRPIYHIPKFHKWHSQNVNHLCSLSAKYPIMPTSAINPNIASTLKGKGKLTNFSPPFFLYIRIRSPFHGVLFLYTFFYSPSLQFLLFPPFSGMHLLNSALNIFSHLFISLICHSYSTFLISACKRLITLSSGNATTAPLCLKITKP